VTLDNKRVSECPLKCLKLCSQYLKRFQHETEKIIGLVNMLHVLGALILFIASAARVLLSVIT